MQRNNKLPQTGRINFNSLMLISFLVVAIFSISLVSAAWYNPFSWGTDGIVEKNEGQWIEIFNDNPDFYSVIPSKSKQDADVYLCSKTATKKNDLKDLDFSTSFNKEQKDMQTKAKLKSIEYNGAICYYYKPAKDEKYLKFGEHSTHFIYTSESITAYEDTAFFNDEYIKIGTLSLSTEGYDYKNGKPNIQTYRGENYLTHTFYIENYSINAITNLRTVDLNNNGEEVERNVNLKFLSYVEVEAPTYETICPIDFDISNPTHSCENVINGTELIQKEQWNDMGLAVEGENYIIGVFADVSEEDYVDIDFDYYGISVLDSSIDWATYTAIANFQHTKALSSSAGQTGGYGMKFRYNGTYANYIISNVTATVGAGCDFARIDYVNGTRIVYSNAFNQTQGGTATFPTNYSLQNATIYGISCVTPSGDRKYTNPFGAVETTGGVEWLSGWMSGDGNEATFWSNVTGGTVDSSSNNIRAIYLSGENLDSSLQVTLTSPANNSNLTSSLQDFVGVVTDNQYVENVSLKIDGAIVETDTSHTNGTYNFNAITITEGYHNWSLLAYDNESVSNESDVWFFNYTQPPVFVELLSPENAITSNNITINMSCWGYKDTGVTQLNMTIDGVLNQTVTNSTPVENLTIEEFIDFSEGGHNWSCSITDGMTSATSSTRTFTIDTTPLIDFLTPPTLVNGSNVSQEYVPMKVNVSTLYFQNITYSLRDVNGTNYTQFYTNETYDINFTDLPDAHYHYDVTVCTTTGECNVTETRHINHDNTLPNITLTAPPELFDYLIEGETLNLNWTVSDLHLDSCWYEYGQQNSIFNSSWAGGPFSYTLSFDTTNKSVKHLISNRAGINYTISLNEDCLDDGDLNLYQEGFFGGSGGMRLYCLDSSANPYLIKEVVGSASVFFDDTWIYYLDKNYVNCAANTTTFDYTQGYNNITFFASDTFGGIANETRNWTSLIGTFDIDYETPVYEGYSNTITATVEGLAAGSSLTSALLYYNGVNYSTSITYDGDYEISATLSAPAVTTDTNYSFGFYLTIDGYIYNPQTNNQTVLNADFGVCGGISNDTILTMNLVDEDTQVSILGDIEVAGEIKSVSSDETIGTIYTNFTNSSNGTLCFSPPAAYELYYMDVEIRYTSDGYVSELYYIQNADITDDLGNLTLYDLNESSSTRFKVTYQDSTYNFVEEAIIQLQRRYISEGVYKAVEAPLTSNEGVSILHINLNSIGYRATIVKDGVILDEFDNLVFNCQSELTGECEHKLLGNIDPENEEDLDNTRDFYYSNPTLNETAKTITISFSIPSGSPSSVNFLLEQKDEFGNETLCNKTIISSAGSISCEYSETLGLSYIDFTLTKDGISIAKKSYIIHPEDYLNWLGNNYIFIFILLLSLVGMALTSPEWIIINGIITMVISGGLYLARGLDFMTGLGNIVWLVIAAVILISKISNQEDR